MANFSVMADVPNPVFDSNGNPFSGAVLKAFLPGTTTSTSIAIDEDGGSPQASITYNAQGKLEVTGNEILPFIDRKHKWGIFANATDAAANTPFYMGPFNNVPAPSDENNIDDTIDRLNPATLAIALADTSIVLDDALNLKERSTGNEGGAPWDVFAAGTFPVGSTIFDVFDHDTLALQLKLRTRNGIANLQEWGCIGDGLITSGVASGTDDSAAFQAAMDSGLKVVGNPTKTYYIVANALLNKGSNHLEDIEILIDDTITTVGLELGPRLADATATTTLTGSDIVINTDTVTVANATGFVVGQLITFKSTRLWPYEQLNAGETNKIREISGTTITLESPMADTYELGSETVTVNVFPDIIQKLTRVSAIRPDKIELGGISIQFSSEAILQDVVVTNCGSSGINISSSWMTRIDNPVLIDCHITGGATGYGIQDNNSIYTLINDMKARGCRRSVDFSGTYPSRYGIVDNFTVTGLVDTGSGVGTHGTAQGIRFSNGKIDGCLIGVQIRGPDCVIDNVDCMLNVTPITLGFTNSLTVQNCTVNPKVIETTAGSLAGVPARFIDIGTRSATISNREKLVVKNNSARTRLDFIRFSNSADGIKHAIITDNFADLLTNTSANQLNFMESNTVQALTECVIKGNTYLVNGHTGAFNFINPNITIADNAENILQRIPLGLTSVVKQGGAGTLVVNNADLTYETDGQYCRIFGEVEFTVSVGTVQVKITGMPQKQDLLDLGDQVGGTFNGAWSEVLVTKNNRLDIFLGYSGYRASGNTLEPFAIGVHGVPIDLKYRLRFPML